MTKSTTNQVEARLAALEAENGELRAEINLLRPRPAPEPRPSDDEGIVRITTLAPTAPGFIMPPDDEMVRLREIVLQHYPLLAPHGKEDEADFHQAFVISFKALGFMSRAAAPDYSRDPCFWVDHASEVIGRLGIAGTLSLAPFTAALVAHGDIAHTEIRNYPFMSFALRRWGDGGGARDAWKAVLRGDLPASSSGR